MKNIFLSFVLIAVASISITACKPKDADIQKSVTETLAGINITQLNVGVNKGIVTVSGQAADENTRTSWVEAVKKLKGVKEIINNLAVAAPVIITADDPLSAAVTELLKAFSTVKGEVAEGVVNLSGSIKRDDWKGLMPKLQELKPKKVVSDKLTIE